MRKLQHTFLLLTFLLVGISLTSCLKDNDVDVTYYSDCAIQSFSLGTLNKYTKTVSSKTGNDTIVKTTVTGSLYRFSIDHENRTIYNVDSLPVGIDTLHVICNIAAVNGGYIYLKSMQSDSLFYYNSADSISFEKNPRTIVVASNDGQYSTKYTVKLNVHKEDSDKMTWNSPYTAPEFIDAEQLQAAEWKTTSKDADGKTVEKDSIVVKVAKGGNVMLYASPVKSGKGWAPLTPDMKLSAVANIAALNGALYTTDEDGKVCKSEDGESWTPVDGISGKVLGVSNGMLYIQSGEELNAYSVAKGSVVKEQFFGISAYPFLAEKNASLCAIVKNSKAVGTTITGVAGDGYGVLYKAENTAEAQKWMILSNEAEQDLPSTYTETVAYGDYLVALSGGKFLSSLDSGRSWQKRSILYTPSGLSAEGQSHLFADSRGILWIFAQNGQVFTGKLNGIAWK